jgi:hypothetical protein
MPEARPVIVTNLMTGQSETYANLSECAEKLHKSRPAITGHVHDGTPFIIDNIAYTIKYVGEVSASGTETFSHKVFGQIIHGEWYCPLCQQKYSHSSTRTHYFSKKHQDHFHRFQDTLKGLTEEQKAETYKRLMTEVPELYKDLQQIKCTL